MTDDEFDARYVALKALVEYANPLNWDVDENGIRRVWKEPGSETPEAYNGFELAKAALSTAAQPPAAPQEELREDTSYESMNLAVMVLSDCGHSSNYTPLLERVAGRIDRHVERLLTAQRADLTRLAQAEPAHPTAGIWVPTELAERVQETMVNDVKQYPPLPASFGHVHSDGNYCQDMEPSHESWPIDIYTAVQMRAYVDADRAMRAAQAAPAAVPVRSQAEPLHITHGPLMRHAAALLRLRKPVLPDFEIAASELDMAVDGHPTPSGEPSPEWLEVARIAGAPTTQAAPQSAAPASQDAEDAARYRWLRGKVAIVGDSFHILNIRPTFVAPDPAVELDAVLDAAMAGETK